MADISWFWWRTFNLSCFRWHFLRYCVNICWFRLECLLSTDDVAVKQVCIHKETFPSTDVWYSSIFWPKCKCCADKSCRCHFHSYGDAIDMECLQWKGKGVHWVWLHHSAIWRACHLFHYFVIFSKKWKTCPQNGTLSTLSATISLQMAESSVSPGICKCQPELVSLDNSRLCKLERAYDFYSVCFISTAKRCS